LNYILTRELLSSLPPQSLSAADSHDNSESLYRADLNSAGASSDTLRWLEEANTERTIEGIEKKSKEMVEKQSKLDDLQCRSLVALQAALLQKHYKFLLDPHHSSESLKRLAGDKMLERMWGNGIQKPIELLIRQLPNSSKYMLGLIHIAYVMITSLVENVLIFRATWFECLGDLARYPLAIIDCDTRDQEDCRHLARYWFNRAADKTPGVGRIQHHLGIMARPDMIFELFHYTKSLISIHPFHNTNQSICEILFDRLENSARIVNDRNSLSVAFVNAHSVLFTKGSINQFIRFGNEFMSHLKNDIGRASAILVKYNVYIASSNYAAIFGYGQRDAILPAMFDQNTIQAMSPLDKYRSAQEYWETRSSFAPAEGLIAENADFIDPKQMLLYASCFAFSTLRISLQPADDERELPYAHFSLAFLWCSALNPASMIYIETYIPWAQIVSFLNTLIRYETDISRIESEEFPRKSTQKLSEDLVIRGQTWSQSYYPEEFFEDTSAIEPASATVSRTQCLWLGVRIAAVSLVLNTIQLLSLLTDSKSSRYGLHTTPRVRYSRLRHFPRNLRRRQAK
jgi:hypothetical protein